MVTQRDGTARPARRRRRTCSDTRRRPQVDHVSIAMVGTRGVPARYGGFETAVEEIGRRLADAGHRVVVYCRTVPGAQEPPPAEHLGMELVHLPAARLPVATHVDGLEWKRAKWGGTGRRYYRAAEALAVRWSDALIADAQGIADYYRDAFAAPTTLLTYGAPLIEPGAHRLAELGLEPRGYHLVVARFEPENHVDVIVEGYAASAATKPLVVVGSAPYADEYTARVHALADDRVRFLGGVWDQELLDQLYANCATYLHGHSVGGTNPSLLRAIGAGAAVTAFDVDFNREVVADAGRYFRTPADVAREVVAVEADPEWVTRSGQRARELAGGYDWDSVAAGYGELARALAERRFPARRPSRRRRRTAADAPPAPRPAQRPAGVVPLPAPASAVEDPPAGAVGPP